jgi:hypothetical protein
MSHKRNPAAEEELSLTIAHYLAAHSLPFSHSEDPLFNRILQKARSTNHKYEPPKRSEVAGKLLDAHFASYQKNGMDSLLADVETYGLAIFGDGATIVKTPLINILASSPNNPSCVLDVIDCSKHMRHGGKKDAWFIAKNILPLMKKIDPHKDSINVVAFDGAANVQKAADLLKEHFPAITVMQGVEHTIATIIGRWTGLRPIKDLCQFSKKVCLYPYVLFSLIQHNCSQFCVVSSAIYLAIPVMHPIQSFRRHRRITTTVRSWSLSSHQTAEWVGSSFSCSGCFDSRML